MKILVKKSMPALLLGIASLNVPLLAMHTTASLEQFPFNGASVLPCTKMAHKSGRFLLMGREAGGPDKGTYDAFGGGKHSH